MNHVRHNSDCKLDKPTIDDMNHICSESEYNHPWMEKDESIVVMYYNLFVGACGSGNVELGTFWGYEFKYNGKVYSEIVLTQTDENDIQYINYTLLEMKYVARDKMKSLRK